LCRPFTTLDSGGSAGSSSDAARTRDAGVSWGGMSLRRIWFAVQLLVTVVLMALLFRAFQWAQFWETISRVPAWLYVGSFLVVLAGAALCCVWLSLRLVRGGAGAVL